MHSRRKRTAQKRSQCYGSLESCLAHTADGLGLMPMKRRQARSDLRAGEVSWQGALGNRSWFIAQCSFRLSLRNSQGQGLMKGKLANGNFIQIAHAFAVVIGA